MEIVNFEKRNFLITEFYEQVLESIFIGISPFDRSYCFSVNLEWCEV